MRTQVTDEMIIDAYLRDGTYAKAGERLGLSKQGINVRLRVMKISGVNIPKMNASGPKGKYTPEEVERLNEYIKQKQS